MPSITPQRFARASRQLAVLMIGGVVAAMTLGFSAFAQDVIVDPVPVEPATTVWGWVFRALVAAAFLLGGWAAVKLGSLLSEQAKNAGFVGLMAKLGITAMASAGTVVARLRPLIDKDLADGKITKEEWNELLAEAVKVFKEVAAKDLGAILPLLGVVGDGAIKSFLEGVVGNAIRKIAVPGVAVPAVPMPAPLAAVLEKAAAVPK